MSPFMMRCYFEEFVLLYVNFVFLVIVTFNLWMNQDVHNTFALVINFLTSDCESKHVIVGMFEAKLTTSFGLTNQLKVLFQKYNLINKIICYVKDEGQFVYNDKHFQLTCQL